MTNDSRRYSHALASHEARSITSTTPTMRSRSGSILRAGLIIFAPLGGIGAQTTDAAQGKVVMLSGNVQHTPAQRDAWNPAAVFQPLYVADRVRTLVASKAAILFIDESQVKLNAGAILTVHTVRRLGAPTTSLELERGEAWFRTKNPASGLTIRTPSAAAAIRGTEINLRVGLDTSTVLTVVEGSVDFSNAAGSIQVNAGEEGTALPGQAPTKRVILNPANAVQWALYYPLDPSVQAIPAAVRLASADVAGARAAIDSALAADPRATEALLVLSTIHLTQNHADSALAAAERALAIDARLVPALIAAGIAEQARFDLDAAQRYFDRALTIDARSVPALVNRARIRFGTGDASGARHDVETATSVAPNDPQVRSLRGFIRLSDGDGDGADADLTAAAAADHEFAEPHLGLGLLHFRRGNVADGLLEMLTATLLEPHVSLYQSYLGKAYYQAGRVTEGLAALASAKQLDPRDPTPWLYTSLFLRDQNRQIDALRELRTAIALNDNRAVYRSRLLLDRDLATKNVSLAEIYRQLGFEAWGAFEALNSVETDYTNASAHLFLANTYGLLPDRLQALASELLQYDLHAAVNRNSFNTFSEYTALIEQPRRQLDVELEGGSRDRRAGSATVRTGDEHFATLAFIDASRRNGARLAKTDDRVHAFLQSKVAIDATQDILVEAQSVTLDRGQDEDAAHILGQSNGAPVIVRQFFTPDPNIGVRIGLREGTLGYAWRMRPGSSFTATARYTGIDYQQSEHEVGITACNTLDVGMFGLISTNLLESPSSALELQVQQVARIGRHQLIVGQKFYMQDKKERCHEAVGLAGEDPLAQDSTDRAGKDRASISYARGELALTDWLHVSAGVAYQRVSYEHFLFPDNEVVDNNSWSPILAFSLRLMPGTFLRAATMKNLNTNAFGSSISPPAIAGFVIDRNELPTATRHESDVSLEYSGSNVFGAMRGFTRSSRVPFLLSHGVLIPDADARAKGASGYVNWIIAPRLSFFADDQLVRFETAAFTREDNLLRGGLGITYPNGVTRLAISRVTQSFSHTVVTALPRSDFTVADIEAGLEFAQKRVGLTLTISNLTDRSFGSVVDGLSIDPLIPRRNATLRTRWRLF